MAGGGGREAACGTGSRREGRSAHGNAIVRSYLYIDQLAQVGPWSPDAIRTMISRGIFKLGVHYFKPHGANGRPIFSWDAIVKYIEGDEDKPGDEDGIALADGTVIDLDEATAKAYRLRD